MTEQVISIGSIVYTLIVTAVIMGLGFIGGWFLGKQDAEIKAEQKRDAERDASLG